jgi:hypothetical protein
MHHSPVTNACCFHQAYLTHAAAGCAAVDWHAVHSVVDCAAFDCAVVDCAAVDYAAVVENSNITKKNEKKLTGTCVYACADI